ncbi:hypothetical protein D6833_00710 [Candidatus Parcubacteria bacterium]|nr:MAG: hypothetical protein D6833_00710 [Candidatus Parcubacteria bacterium]
MPRLALTGYPRKSDLDEKIQGDLQACLAHMQKTIRTIGITAVTLSIPDARPAHETIFAITKDRWYTLPARSRFAFDDHDTPIPLFPAARQNGLFHVVCGRSLRNRTQKPKHKVIVLCLSSYNPCVNGCSLPKSLPKGWPSLYIANLVSGTHQSRVCCGSSRLLSANRKIRAGAFSTDFISDTTEQARPPALPSIRGYLAFRIQDLVVHHERRRIVLIDGSPNLEEVIHAAANVLSPANVFLITRSASRADCTTIHVECDLFDCSIGGTQLHINSRHLLEAIAKSFAEQHNAIYVDTERLVFAGYKGLP